MRYIFRVYFKACETKYHLWQICHLPPPCPSCIGSRRHFITPSHKMDEIERAIPVGKLALYYAAAQYISGELGTTKAVRMR